MFRELQNFWYEFKHPELKRHSGKECARIMLSEVKHPDLYLKLGQGVEVKSLCELANVLKEMDDQNFKKCVKCSGSHFSEWVRNSVGDFTLADKLEELDSREEFARAVEVRVSYIKQRAKY